MSLFGEPLPFEDDTATSLIRRSGFPPEGTYDQMPEVYLCPCCSEFSKQQERDRLIREAREAKEAERRRLLQLDVFDERAKPLPSGDTRRKAYRRIVEDEEPEEITPTVPPPPPTLDELRRARKDQNVPKLVVTVHHGRNIHADSEDPISVIVRCGAFEGQTAKVPRGKDVATPWEELFEFPYMNSSEPLEVMVVNDTLPPTSDQLVGGVVVPSNALYDRNRGEQEPLPIMPENEMQNGYGQVDEGPLGTVVASWYVRSGDDKMNESEMESKTLATPLGCTFVAHRIFQYTDHGAEPYPGGVLCVVRDTDDNCSESVLYKPGDTAEPSVSPYYTKEGYHYLPENPSQIMQLSTEKKLGHLLICVPRQEDGPRDGPRNDDEDEELIVIGAVPLDFDRMYNKGRAVLLIECKTNEDSLWGEISVEWANKPLDEEAPHPAAIEVQRESLFVTVVRGLNLIHRDNTPVTEGYVSVAAGEMEGTTVEAPCVDDGDGNNVINWNQEVRFIDVERDQKELEVQVFEKGRLVSVGKCELGSSDEGVVIVQMYHAAATNEEAGEIVVSYKRLHANEGPQSLHRSLARAVAAATGHDQDEEDEEDEEKEEVPPTHHAEAVHLDEDEEDEEQEENYGAGGAADRSVDKVTDDDSNKDRHAEEQEELDSDAHNEREKHVEELDDGRGQSGSDHLGEEADEEQYVEEDLADGHQNDDRSAHDSGAGDEYPEEEPADAYEGDDHDGQDRDGNDGHDGDSRDGHDGHDGDSHDGRDGHDGDSHDGRDGHDGDSHDGRDGHDGDSRDGRDGHDGDSHDGRDGHDGDSHDGRDGHDGDSHDGRDGHDGDSHDGRDGLDGHDGDGHDGHDGDSHDGRDGHDGHDGDSRDGHDGEDHDGHDGHDGESQEYPEEETADAYAGDGRDDQDQDAHDGDDDNAGQEERYSDEELFMDDKDQNERDHDENVDDNGEGDEREPPSVSYKEDPEEIQPDEEPIDEAAFKVPTSGHQRGRRISWKPSSRKASMYKQPWYPSGCPEGEQHIPFEKTKLSKANKESIRALETRKNLLEEESVRRSSVSRGSRSSSGRAHSLS